MELGSYGCDCLENEGGSSYKACAYLCIVGWEIQPVLGPQELELALCELSEQPGNLCDHIFVQASCG